MTPAASRPDLRRIGASAIAEVLGNLLSLPVTVRNPTGHSLLSVAPDQITCTVLLTGQRLSGSVHLHLPRAFIASALRVLTRLDRAAGETNALLDDAAGELVNMVAGRVAAGLATDGYPCTLGIPSVSHRAALPIEIQPAVEQGRTDLMCEGHWLSLEVRCRFASP